MKIKAGNKYIINCTAPTPMMKTDCKAWADDDIDFLESLNEWMFNLRKLNGKEVDIKRIRTDGRSGIKYAVSDDIDFIIPIDCFDAYYETEKPLCDSGVDFF